MPLLNKSYRRLSNSAIAKRYKYLVAEKPRLFLACMTLGLAFCATIIYLAPPSYQVRIALPKQNNGSAPSQKADINNPFFEKQEGYTDHDPRLFISNELANQLVTKLDLQNEYFQIKSLKKRALYSRNQPIIIKTIANTLHAKQHFEIAIISKTSFILNDHDEKTTYQFKEIINKDDLQFTIIKDSSFFRFPYQVALEISSPEAAAQDLLHKIAIETADPVRGDMQVKVEDEVLRRAFDISDTLHNMYLSNTDSYAASKTLNSIQQQIKGLDKYFSAYHKPKKTILKPSKTAAIVDPDELQQAEKQLNILKTLSRYTKISVKQFSLIPDNYGLLSDSLNNLIQKINGIQLEKQKVLNPDEQENMVVENFDYALVSLHKRLAMSIKNQQKYFSNLIKNPGIPESDITLPNNPELAQKQIQSTVEYKENLKRYNDLSKEYRQLAAMQTGPSDLKKQMVVPVKTYSGFKRYNILFILLGLAFSFIFPLIFTRKKREETSVYHKESATSKKLSMGY